MSANYQPNPLSKGKSTLLLLFFVLLTSLIVIGLYNVTRKKEVEKPAPPVIVESQEEVVIPVDVSLSDTELEVGVGITKTVQSVGGERISRSSSNEKVATVADDGSVKGIGVGNCELTAENEFGRTAHGDVTVKKTVYLTIDDCPMRYTADILDVLKQNDVKATFFVMNTYNNRMLKNIYRDGHVIGLHTYTHTFKKCYRTQYSYFAGLEKLADIVERYTGTRPKIFRFPGGTGNHVGGKLNMRRMVNGAADLGYRGFDWTSSSGDATRPPLTAEQAAENTLKTCKRDSDILLMHDKPCTPGALEIVIPELKKRGYVFETLDHYPEYSHLSKTWYERTVSKNQTPCESIGLNKDFIELNQGESLTLKATMTPEESTDYVRFESDDTSVATVTLEGTVTGVKSGVTQVRAITTSGQEAICSITVI